MYTYQFCPVCGNSLEKRPHDSHHRNYCPRCSFVHYVNPLPAVVAIVEKERQLLLIQRGKSPAQGEWTFPSGFIEANESPEEACLRELKEETGIEGKIKKLIGVYYEKSAMYGDVLNIAYALSPSSDTLPKAGDDAINVRYVPLKEMGEIAFDSFRRALKDYKEQLVFSQENKIR